jgi:hypothetical protein
LQLPKNGDQSSRLGHQIIREKKFTELYTFASSLAFEVNTFLYNLLDWILTNTETVGAAFCHRRWTPKRGSHTHFSCLLNAFLLVRKKFVTFLVLRALVLVSLLAGIWWVHQKKYLLYLIIDIDFQKTLK